MNEKVLNLQDSVKNVGIKDIQDELLLMSLNIHELLTKYNIPYYMLGGTMLGAVRHKGFIPWDDDMDFGIPRVFYDEAKRILKEELPSHYRLLQAIDGNALYDTTKIENTNITIEEIGAEGVEKGIFVDIFPLDIGNNKWSIFSRNRWIRIFFAINSFKYSMTNSFKGKIISLFVKLLPANFFHSLAKSLIKAEGDYIINYGGYWGKKEIIHKKVFGVPKLYEFESYCFYGVEDYDSYSKSMYNDYMTLPPEDKRHVHILSFKVKNKNIYAKNSI